MYSNTSYVAINRRSAQSADGLEKNSNTSYVAINQNLQKNTK